MDDLNRRSSAVPSIELGTFDLAWRLMVDLGEAIAVSTDPAIVATVAKAQDDIARRDIIWDEITD